jgi:hypothetical protein
MVIGSLGPGQPSVSIVATAALVSSPDFRARPTVSDCKRESEETALHFHQTTVCSRWRAPPRCSYLFSFWQVHCSVVMPLSTLVSIRNRKRCVIAAELSFEPLHSLCQFCNFPFVLSPRQPLGLCQRFLPTEPLQLPSTWPIFSLLAMVLPVAL